MDDHPVSREGQRAVLSAEGEGDSRNTNDDTISRLERLATLKERGILTDEEFREQKRKILGA